MKTRSRRRPREKGGDKFFKLVFLPDQVLDLPTSNVLFKFIRRTFNVVLLCPVFKMKTLLNANVATKVGLISSIAYLWKIGNLSSQTAAALLAPGIVWQLVNRRTLRKITPRDLIVLTGCDSGLGYSFALYCNRHLSARVFAGVHRTDSLGAQELQKNGIAIQQIDITNSQSISNFVSAMEIHLKSNRLKLRAFINNAGVMIFGEFEWQTEAQIGQQIEVNLVGTMRLTKSLIPLLREHKSRLIIVTSHCANEALPGVATYAATKAGLSAWATALRMELKKFHIDVITFIPGSFVTDSNILMRQLDHFHTMEQQMSPEAASVYKEYFKEYRNYLKPLSRDNSLVKIDNKQLYSAFENSLMEEPARSNYKCEPWRYTFYHTLLKFTPTKIHDFLIEKFVQMPAWRPSTRITNSETHKKLS